MLRRAQRLVNTVRYLRPIQIYGRARFRLAQPRPDTSPPPAVGRGWQGWETPALRAPSLSAPGAFDFLGEPGTLAREGWDNPARAKLWRYNQHYFDDLNAVDAAARVAWHDQLIADWIRANPPAEGTGWEPYPLSLRIVNWVKFALSGGKLSPDALASLAVQARYLARRIEWHLLGNHLFANAKALLFAARFFEGEEARSWQRLGARILARELPEQFLADGAHFELSPMYHALATEDLLDLVNLLRASDARSDDPAPGLVDAVAARVEPALHWLAAMAHPDERIAFFNDAAFGIAPEIGELMSYAGRLGFTPAQPPADFVHLAPSGYFTWQHGAAKVIGDVAAVGPDYLPGHAHADTLSFELSLHGTRVIVNSGTSEYGTGAERLRQRGTAAHNTVLVEGEDSSEVWSGFRVARRARVRELAVTREHPGWTVRASHDGYRRLPGRPIHERRWHLSEGSVTIDDRVSGGAKAEARFHLHPDIAIVEWGESGAVLQLAGGQRARCLVRGGRLRVEASTWHPRFGERLDNQCLVLPLHDGRSEFAIEWS